MSTPLPPARRIVTGHNAEGKSILESDMKLQPIDPHTTLPPEQRNEDAKNTGGFVQIFRTDCFPAKTQGPWKDYHGLPMPLADSEATTVRIVDMPPGMSSPMHRTASLDIGTLVFGEVVLEMDDEVETVLHVGDTVVQRSTMHAWHNRTEEMSRMSFVLVPGRPVIMEGKELEPTKYPVNYGGGNGK